MERSEKDSRYKEIREEELLEKPQTHRRAGIYMHDSHEEFAEEIRQRGEPFSIEEVDEIVKQDLIAAVRLISEDMRKSST